jgi:hypothetical protein
MASMDSSALLRIWSSITDELALHQDRAPGDFRGQVVNPISGMIYARDTAFSAKVFATEYRRTGEEKWLLRSKGALDSLSKVDVYSGIDYPIWTRYGWDYEKGSLAPTGMSLDAIWDTKSLLGLKDEGKEQWNRLFRYLEGCLVGPGLFAHALMQPRTDPPAIQNTTAIALYLLEYAASKVGDANDLVLKERDLALLSLSRGQRIDGFWPYIYPGPMQQFFFRFPAIRPFIRRLPIVRRYFYKAGDRSVFFGDVVHHCLVFYYLVKSILLREPNFPYVAVVNRGWEWIYKHLVETSYGGLRVDFDWEPKPLVPRYCNFRETSTYFLILATLLLLARMGVIGDEFRSIASGLLIHIENSLLENEGTFPGIKPYEGPVAVLRNILPRVGESVAWKGSCLCQLVLAKSSLGVFTATD